MRKEVKMTKENMPGKSEAGREEKVKTAASKKNLQASRENWPFVKEDYRLAHQWKAEGKPIAWSCTGIPKEIYWAMGIRPLFPEHYAAICAGSRKGGSKDESVEKEAVRLSKLAETAGFRDYVCGYARVGAGYVLGGDLTDAPLGGMPKPDVLITSSGLCDLRLKWFEDMAERLNVPLFIFDIPEIAQDLITITPNLRSLVYPSSSALKRDLLVEGPSDWALEYLVAQLEELIEFLERNTGAKLSETKLNEALEWSHKTVDVRLEIQELRKAVPAPMSAADGFATMYPGLYAIGRKDTYDYYVRMRDELKQRVAAGVGVVPEEKFRLMWYGVPPWFNMSIMNYFESLGGVFVYEFAYSYNAKPWPMRRPENLLKELAMILLHEGKSVGSTVSSMIHDCHEYKISGAVLSYLITCRPLLFPVTEIWHALQAEIGMPVAVVEGDLVDERTVAEGQISTRLDALGEVLIRKGTAA
jgi:benzoyl-CoA reductase/2-hydroxyglutaryl-CoA dehydratase subunit BcrC/BadD/HgdB